MKRANSFATNQLGAGRIKLTIVVLVIMTVGLILYRGLPVYITDQEMQHDVKEVARTASMRNNTEGQIRRELLKAQEGYWVELPPDTEYNIIKKPHGVQIEVNTTIPINFIVTTYNYKINIKVSDTDM